ncbi:MAG: hypothetical protein D6675_11555 [Gemmatimonadetes bacterium]|nr:MAG: hypothetical protein D6675_11555 [Gemmatimonadota bacterium]
MDNLRDAYNKFLSNWHALLNEMAKQEPSPRRISIIRREAEKAYQKWVAMGGIPAKHAEARQNAG